MTDTAHAVSPDSGTHWTEPGAWSVAPGVHRIPLPLPMDGLKAVNVYVLETGDGLTLIDGGWAIEASRTLLEKSLADLGAGIGDIRRFLVTHVHRDHYTQAVTIRREVGSHVSLGLGDKPTLDLINAPDLGEDPHLAMFIEAGAPHIARAWADFTRNSTPDLDLWAYPDTWLDGDLQLTVGERTLDAVHTPGHTRGPLRLRRHRGRAALRRRPRAAHHHPVDRVRAGARARSARRLHGLARPGPRAPRPAAAACPRPGRTVQPRPGRRAPRPPRGAAGAEPGGCPGAVAQTSYDVAGELPWTRHGRRLAELDVFNSAMATLETRAHLSLLVARGDLTRTETDGVAIYA